MNEKINKNLKPPMSEIEAKLNNLDIQNVSNNEERVAVCDHCNGTGWDSYPNHSTTIPPCTKCQP